MVLCPCCGSSDKRRAASWPVVPAVDAITARIAELESANAALMAERASYIATHREHEDRLRTRVKELEAENERLRNLAEAGRLAVGDHFAPNDCYATGPLTGDPYRDLVGCPACSFIAMHDAVIVKAST